MTKKTDVVDIIDKVTGEVHQEEVVVEASVEKVPEIVVDTILGLLAQENTPQTSDHSRPKFSPEVFATADVNSVGKVFFRLLPGEFAGIKAYLESLGFKGKISMRIFPDNRWMENAWKNSQNNSTAQVPEEDDLWKIVLRPVMKNGKIKQAGSGDIIMVAIPVCDSPEY